MHGVSTRFDDVEACPRRSGGMIVVQFASIFRVGLVVGVGKQKQI